MNLLEIPFIRADGDHTLLEVFSEKNRVANICANAAETLVDLKFLGAVCLAACRPETRKDIEALDNKTLASKVTAYLQNHRELFELDGDRPFLQYRKAMQAKAKADCPSIADFTPGCAAGNRGVVRCKEVLNSTSWADRVRALLFAVILPFSGKRTDGTVWISPSGQGKKKPFLAPALGMGGLVHSFIFGETLLDTLRLNLVSEEDLKSTPFTSGIGVPPWEKMPQEEDDTAQRLRTSWIGRLVPMLRFVCLEGDKVHATYGVAPVADIDEPTGAYRTDGMGKKRPIRMLSASNFSALADAFGFTQAEQTVTRALQLRICLETAKRDPAYVAVVLLGLRTSYNAGEQYFSTGDEMFQTQVAVSGSEESLQEKFRFLSSLQKNIYRCFAALRQTMEAGGLQDEPKLNGTPAKNYVALHCDTLLRSLSGDVAELLSLHDEQEIQACEKKIAEKVRKAVHFEIGCCGPKAGAMSGRIEFNPTLFFNRKDLEKTDEN